MSFFIAKGNNMIILTGVKIWWDYAVTFFKKANLRKMKFLSSMCVQTFICETSNECLSLFLYSLDFERLKKIT